MAPQNSEAFFEAAKARRSYYKITNRSPIADERIIQIVKDAVISTPTSFNGQSVRAVLLLKKDHEEFWDMVLDVLQPHLPDDAAREKTKGRISMFRAGYGTVLFFDDPACIKNTQEQFPMYADRFPTWGQHSSAMLQYILWTALEAEGFGASLQHYNPLIDQRAKARWDVPSDWPLYAMLPFGQRVEPDKGWTEGKEVKPVEERVFVHGV